MYVAYFMHIKSFAIIHITSSTYKKTFLSKKKQTNQFCFFIQNIAVVNILDAQSVSVIIHGFILPSSMDIFFNKLKLFIDFK